MLGLSLHLPKAYLVLCPERSVSEVPELRAGACCAVPTAVCTPVVAFLPRPRLAEAQLVLQQAPSSSQVCRLFYCCLSVPWISVFLGLHTLPGVIRSQVCCVSQSGFKVFDCQQESILWFVPRAA